MDWKNRTRASFRFLALAHLTGPGKRVGLSVGLWVVALSCLGLALAASGIPAGNVERVSAEPNAVGTVGYQGPDFPGVGDPTMRAPQSKLWYNDGIWWASMYDKQSVRYEIFKLDWASQTWSSTDVAIDTRPGSYADVLWDGTRLYIASGAYPGRASNYEVRLLRYTYVAATKTYTPDTGFPVVVYTAPVITVVIDKDSTGVLWMTFTAPHDPNCVEAPNSNPSCTRDIFVTHGTTPENTVWVTPYVPRVGTTQGNLVTQTGPDTVASLVKFGGNKIGLIWDHGPFSALYFTYRTDGAGDADSDWSPIISVARKADNHLNLKSLDADPNGKIYAIVKNDCNEPSGGGCSGTGTVNQNDALIWLFAVDATGVQSYTVSRVRDDQTRPIIALDTERRNLYVMATTTYRTPGDPTNITTTITYKQTSMDSVAFMEGRGIPFIKDNTNTRINDATTTKQSVNSTSNLVVLAADSTGTRKNYFHNVLYLNDDPVMVGAGDIASCKRPGDEQTAALLDGIPGTVFTLGDNVYDEDVPGNPSTAAAFNNCYDPSWGRHKSRTYPVVGNHEYQISGAAPYYQYFGARAGDPSKGYYSFDQGPFWRVIVLNSNCSAVGGCGAGSPQEQWLRAELAANANKNVLALFHHPRFSSDAGDGNVTSMQAFWVALYEYGADLVVSSHSHTYERFAPQDPYGNADPNYGIREILNGLGGFGTRGFNTPEPNSEVRHGDPEGRSTRGVLRLTLRPNSYEWLFVPISGQQFTDWGTGAVHGAPPPPAATPTRTSTGTPTNTVTATSTPVTVLCSPQPSVSGSITVDDPTFNRASAFAQGSTCTTNTNGQGVHYDYYEYQLAGPSTVTASMHPAGGGSADFDSHLAIYQAPSGARISPFVPNACTNAVAANNDFGGTRQSQVQANLVAGYFYVVVTQFLNDPAPNACNGIDCYGDYTLSLSGVTCLAPTSTPTATATDTATDTATSTATATNTSTATSTATNTATSTATSTATTLSATATNTPLNAATATSTRTPTGIPSSTATGTVTTVSSTPTASPTACLIEFADVPPTGEGSTFYTFIKCLACRNIVSGYRCGGTGEPCNDANDPYFRPGLNVTRGQISKMVALAAGLSGPTGDQRFEDVPPSNTFYDPIQQLASRGYVGGYPCGAEAEPCVGEGLPYFRPGAQTTRGQLSKIVSETASFDELPGEQRFADVQTDSPFYVWIQRLAGRGIISGYECGSSDMPCDSNKRPYFLPNADVTRGQTAKIVANTFFPDCDSQTP